MKMLMRALSCIWGWGYPDHDRAKLTCHYFRLRCKISFGLNSRLSDLVARGGIKIEYYISSRQMTIDEGA